MSSTDDRADVPNSLAPAKTPTQKVLRQQIWNRMHINNEHFMGCIVGREGFGKSHTALKIASNVDPEFTAERVFFNPKDLLEAFQSDDLGKGNIIILDEAGVGMGNRSWYEKEQILLNQVLQTVRDDNMGVLFTLPRLEELDSQTIGRLHAFIEMVDIDRQRGFATAKWKNVSLTRDGRGREYKQYPRIRVDGTVQRITQIAFRPPNPELVKAYEARKESFKDDLYGEAIQAYDDAEEEKEMTPSEVAEEILQDGSVEEFVSEHGQNGMRYVDSDLLGAEYDLSVRKSKTAKKLIEKEIDVGE